MSTVIAFSPSDADYATDGHVWSVYDPELDHPYHVDEGLEKLQTARERIDPHDYETRDGYWWVRLDYQSIVEGNPERIDPEWGKQGETDV